MIVNYNENSWQIISQRAHGLLAGEICFQWKKEFRPKRWLETIIATTEHDDVFNEFDNDDVLLNENGGPINFKMRDFEKDKCDQLLSYALTKSSYIALLTAHHIRFLYGESDEPKIKQYISNLKKTEKLWMQTIEISEEEVSYAYSLLQWCDAFSLLICQQLIQPENRKIEISAGPGNQSYQLRAPESEKLVVEPWPFETDDFEISYEFRTLSQLKFKDVKEFRKVLMEAPLNSQVYHVCKS